MSRVITGTPLPVPVLVGRWVVSSVVIAAIGVESLSMNAMRVSGCIGSMGR
ncbi:hypothetical protein BB170200_01033 [Mycobacterium marinum]|nr:hypothetical protein BB170200_01033 [Mycobacterium marinum]